MNEILFQVFKNDFPYQLFLGSLDSWASNLDLLLCPDHGHRHPWQLHCPLDHLG